MELLAVAKLQLLNAVGKGMGRAETLCVVEFAAILTKPSVPQSVLAKLAQVSLPRPSNLIVKFKSLFVVANVTAPPKALCRVDPEIMSLGARL